MVMKKIKNSTKKLNQLILKQFPNASVVDAIIFETFAFGISDFESEIMPVHLNQNWMIGNKDNIFLVTYTDNQYTIQKLEQPLIFKIPEGFLHPDFENLVELNFKNFTSYLIYESLNKKLPSKIKSKQSKI